MAVWFRTDSRGRLFDLPANFRRDFYPGITTSKLVIKTERDLLKCGHIPQFVYFFVGINDFTTKESSGEMVYYRGNQLRTLTDNVQNFTESIEMYGTRVVWCTIPSGSIQNYNDYKKVPKPNKPYYVDMQKQLNEDVHLFNCFLIDFNEKRDIMTPFMARILKIKRNSIWFNPTKLFDGLHPTPEFAKELEKVLMDTVGKNLKRT